MGIIIGDKKETFSPIDGTAKTDYTVVVTYVSYIQS